MISYYPTLIIFRNFEKIKTIIRFLTEEDLMDYVYNKSQLTIYDAWAIDIACGWRMD
jgi:hypothetical protein